jgi:hypothetical protein
MAHTVFICHSARDKQVADAACAVLESHRIPCWIAPRDILGGDEWGEAIVNAINDCRILLVIFSGHANTSPQVRREIERGVSKGKVILPFRIEDVQPTGAMEYALGNTHWLDAIKPPLENSLIQLAHTVGRIVERRIPDTASGNAVPARTFERADIPTREPHADTIPIPSTHPLKRNSLAIAVIVGLVLVVTALIARIGLRPTNSLDTTKFQAAPASAPTAQEAAATPTVSTIPSPAPQPTGKPPVAQDKTKAAPKPADSHVQSPPVGLTGVALAEAMCDEGSASYCDKAAHIYRGQGDRTKEDLSYRKASALYEKACTNGQMGSCTSLGYLYWHGQGVAQDDPRAFALFTKACDGNDGAGCFAKGYCLDVGTCARLDKTEAFQAFGKACFFTEPEGCYYQGLMYLKGDGVAQDSDKGKEFLEKSCSMGYAYACDKVKTLN